MTDATIATAIGSLPIGFVASRMSASKRASYRDLVRSKAGDIKEIDGRPIAKRGRIPGTTDSPRLKPVDLARFRLLVADPVT